MSALELSENYFEAVSFLLERQATEDEAAWGVIAAVLLTVMFLVTIISSVSEISLPALLLRRLTSSLSIVF